MKKIFILISICTYTLVTHTVQAQLFSDEPINNIIPLAPGITITVTGVNQNPTFSTISDYVNGVYKTNAVLLKVTAIRGYTITALAATPNFSTSTTSIIPCSTLSVVDPNFDNFSPLSSTVAAVLFTRATAGTNITHNVDYLFNPGFGYKAGVYTLSVIYTATLN